MDGFTEASLLLNSALEQLEEVCRERGSRSSLNRSPRLHIPTHLNNNHLSIPLINKMNEIDEGLDMDNGNGRDADDERSTKETGWRTRDWRNRRGSDGSSGVESPPSDIPTSSSSLSNPPKLYQDFIKAIEDRVITEVPNIETQLKIMKWMTGDHASPSPSMSTVSCPEYPDLQEKIHRLAMTRDSLSLQVSVLSEQVSAQKEKIRDLEAQLSLKSNNLTSTEQLLQDNYHRAAENSDLEHKRMGLMAEVTNLKMKYATLEREKTETERKLKLSQNEMEHVNQSMHGIVAQQQFHMNGSSNEPNPPGNFLFALREHRNEKQEDEMDQLRTTVQRLIVDNEQKNLQINSLRNALDEQIRIRQENIHSPRWNEQPYDVNTQIRRLLMEEPSDQMSHSTSFPISLCSSSLHHMPRSTVQSSSSFTSSLSAASPPQTWAPHDPSKHMLHQTSPNLRNDVLNYRPPSSPAARQLAAELDELRKVGDCKNSHASYSTASLPRGMGAKASSTLTLPPKKFSLASGTSNGELRTTQSVNGATPKKKYREQMNRWITGKLKINSRATSAPNLVESDDEVARGRNSAAASQTSSSNLKPLRRDRTRSSLRNLFSKLTRSTSQDQHAFRRGSAARSTSSARLGSTGPVPGAIAIRPPLSQFVDWRSDQLAEWIAEVGFAQYVPDIAKSARSGRHLLNLNMSELESVIGMRNPLHRKRLKLILQSIEDDVNHPATKWDVHQTLRWLEEIGLPQYKDVFEENIVDGPILCSLTAGDLVEMRVVNSHHFSAIARSVQHLKVNGFKNNVLEKHFDPKTIANYPCSETVARWSHAATCEWLKTIDLAEFTPNLFCAGTPGALMVYEPTFTAESLAEILQMPPHKTLLRRHLTSHFNQLLGQRVISEKRDFLATGTFPQLSPNNRVKVLKKGFSLPRKKVKNEICFDADEPVCPKNPQSEIFSNGDSTSLESSNV